VRTLEKLGGVPDPTRSSLIQGRWKLIFTTRPGTASPIQRTFVGVDVFTIFQEIFLDTSYPRVSNIVQFSDKVGNLKVEAEATVKDGNRILFRFDQAAFSFKFLPFKVPYPVPFRLLGDEAKGWLDTTYLSTTGNIRISRGNKGTTFVLQKKIEPRQQLLSAISTSRGIEENIDKLIAIRQKEEGKGFEMKEGKWQLLWSSKMAVERGSLSEMANVGSVKGLQIIKKNGEFENVYNAFPGLKVCSKGEIKHSSHNIYHSIIRNRVYMIGSLELPLDEVKTEFDIELLYADNKVRISKGYKQVISVHLYID